MIYYINKFHNKHAVSKYNTEDFYSAMHNRAQNNLISDLSQNDQNILKAMKRLEDKLCGSKHCGCPKFSESSKDYAKQTFPRA